MVCKSVSQQQTRCGIADYATSLYKSLIKPECSKGDLKNAVLMGGEPVYYTSVLDQHSLNLMHLQLEYQFISPSRLKLFSDYCKDSNIRQLITMHTVNPKATDYPLRIDGYTFTLDGRHIPEGAVQLTLVFTPPAAAPQPTSVTHYPLGQVQTLKDGTQIYHPINGQPFQLIPTYKGSL
jgi:hypothetical protein